MINNLPTWADYGAHGESRFPELWEGCLAAWAPCLGPTGTKLHDTSGRGAFGTLANMTPSNDLMVRDGIYAAEFSYFSGSARPAIEIPTLASIRGRQAASISMWVMLKLAPSVQAALYYEPTSSDGFTKFGLFQSTTNQIVFVGRDTASGSSFAITATPTAGAWVHVCGTYNATTDLMELFFNGVSAGTNVTAKGALHDSAPASVMAIGAFTQNTSPALQYTCSAFIDDVRINAKIFSRSEIRTLASSRGIAFQKRLRKSYFAEQLTPTFQAAWAKRPTQLIGGGTY